MKKDSGTVRAPGGSDGTGNQGDLSAAAVFFRDHSLSLIIALLSLFFVIGITSPALYTNDEWITANQLHQLDIGHQVTFSEGKYGVTQNGTVSAYFTYRQNLLVYSLALPLAALPVVKLFGLLMDNFRLIVILLWSLCLILAALLLDARYPAMARVRGMRILFPALLLSLLLFMANILLYKQFPFSPPDAPFEVAALVLTSQVFFALTAAVVFETLREILKDTWTALFGTFATISCSSLIFWAGTAKDHMLTAFVLSLVICCFIRYLGHRRWQDALAAFFFSGILVWVRPEIGFFVTIFMGLFFCIPPVLSLARHGISARQTLAAVLPAAGVFLGGIPFFINNTVISHNWLIPAMDLPSDLVQPGSEVTVPLPMGSVVTDPTLINQSAGMTLPQTLQRVGGIIQHTMLDGFTVDNLISGFVHILTFPENNSIGFIIMCPLVVIGLCALLCWWKRVLDRPWQQNEVLLFLFLMIAAVFVSYMTKFGSMNTSLGIIPDMRYLAPAYIPCGLFSIAILSRASLIGRPKQYLAYSLTGAVVAFPLLFILMIAVHPFGNDYAGYSAFFKYTILAGLAACVCTMAVSRWYRREAGIAALLLPFTLILVIITVLSFQIMLTSFYGMIMKMNGYPFWIPLVREWVNLFFVVQYTPPV